MEELSFERCEEGCDMAGGNYHTVLRSRDGVVTVSGNNDYGQLGLAGRDDREGFTVLPTSLPVAQVACGSLHTFLRFEDGTLAACGHSYQGQLGLRGDGLRLAPVPEITKGCPRHCTGFHTVLRFEDGTVAGCGRNYEGQLGLRELVVERFTRLPTSAPVLQVACTHKHTSLRLGYASEDGTLTTYGSPFATWATYLAIAEVACGANYFFLLFGYASEGRIDRVLWRERSRPAGVRRYYLSEALRIGSGTFAGRSRCVWR